jgi:hypothetical protein
MKTKIVWCAALLTGALSAADFPVVLSHLATGPSAHVDLTNTAEQPVTAWSLAVTTHPDSGRTHREVQTADGYLSEATHGLAGSSEPLERLLPGQSRQIPLDPLPPDATLQVIAVVMDDGTALGDEEILASIFARRVKERDALGAVVDAFDDVLPAKHGAEALTALRERLDALAERDASLPCRAAIDSVNAYQRQATAANADEIDRSLRTYAAFVEREHDLAERHARRTR